MNPKKMHQLLHAATTVVWLLSMKVAPTFGAIYDQYSELPSGREYDFVIAGGGTAGLALASRLSEESANNVLVLEAGTSSIGVFNITVPFFSTRMMLQYDWNLTTTVQPGLGDRWLFFPRGFILGGSSSINGMFYTRGSADDFDRFAAVTEDDGWSWDNIQQYLSLNEKFVPPAGKPNTTGEFSPEVCTLFQWRRRREPAELFAKLRLQSSGGLYNFAFRRCVAAFRQNAFKFSGVHSSSHMCVRVVKYAFELLIMHLSS